MIASFHLADLCGLNSLRALRRPPRPHEVSGLRYAALTIPVPLGGGLAPRPQLGKVALTAAWEDDEALDRFLESHPLAEAMAGGWITRLQPTHIFGAWPPLAGLVGEAVPMDEEEPGAVLTIGRLRLTQAGRFLRASAAAERLAVGDPAMVRGTGLARPPALVATFSLWRSIREMRAYAAGAADPAHRAAAKAHAARPFHHAAAFIRFRPYGTKGRWDGSDPLAEGRPAPAALA